ncbi:MAG TPA: class I SAM-dependent methyltransferase [Aliidongia sp.]|uniref:class I SAM-dependent methyltransferase n=1 Tax=Aliidongia sp. TaxID=1914230 RepID=UPI002DDD4E2E|nr:class I SAM-dependent methyltransferase [Aliidongia sp.]HEV2674051.1 class I SAM-dependent methyltransferase [Aliidongia sp.]
MSDFESRPHSSAYFGEERDYWWNDDYLDLLARRLGLDRVGVLADVGCGIGHWGGLLARHLPANAEMIGIDRDPANVAGARQRFARLWPDLSTRFVEGDATALPLDDRSVDLATCQTLLIHLAQPMSAIAEMIRVTRPGGQVVAVEPNNLFNRMAVSSLTADMPLDRQIEEASIAMRLVEGRRRRGLGCEYLGDLLPGLFAAAGLADIRVWLSDRALALVPPYGPPEQQAQLAAIERWQREGSGPYDRTEFAADLAAGGADEFMIERGWQAMLDGNAQASASIAERRYHAAGGGLFYIVAGRVR